MNFIHLPANRAGKAILLLKSSRFLKSPSSIYLKIERVWFKSKLQVFKEKTDHFGEAVWMKQFVVELSRTFCKDQAFSKLQRSVKSELWIIQHPPKENIDCPAPDWICVAFATRFRLVFFYSNLLSVILFPKFAPFTASPRTFLCPPPTQDCQIPFVPWTPTKLSLEVDDRKNADKKKSECRMRPGTILVL